MPVYYPDFVKQWNNTGGIKYLYGFRRPLAYIDLYKTRVRIDISNLR